MQTTRLYGLDLVRGICAALVCVYHVLAWAGGPVLHTLGTYCVYVFFAVSGASLYLGYAGRLTNRSALVRFFVRRFLRLAPLYIGVVAFGLFLKLGGGHPLPDVTTILLNVSLLFGFTGAAATSLVTGGWSIGIEVLFYAMFPLLLAVMSSRLMFPMLFIAFIVQHGYINATLGGVDTLSDAWVIYTQPVSFIFYFVAGIGIARASTQTITPRAWYWPILGLLFITLAVFSVADKVDSLTGMIGAGLSLLAVGIAFVSTRLPLQGAGLRIGKLIGDASFGVYLIHPFVYGITQSIFPVMKSYPLLAAAYTLAVSGAAALVVDRWYERPIRRWMTQRAVPSVSPRTG